mgnify:CR=1 FL=1
MNKEVLLLEIDILKKNSCLKAVIVEGKKDKISLMNFGIQNVFF